MSKIKFNFNRPCLYVKKGAENPECNRLREALEDSLGEL